MMRHCRDFEGSNPSAPKLILNGHVDVASVDDDSNWTYPPFELLDDWLYGRGVSDMKGGMASLFYVLEKLHQEGRQPKGDIIVQSVVGEEVGEAGTKLVNWTKADLALVLDTSENMALGQGGVITGWITVKSKIPFMTVRGVKPSMLVVGYLVRVPLKNDKNYSRTKRIRTALGCNET